MAESEKQTPLENEVRGEASGKEEIVFDLTLSKNLQSGDVSHPELEVGSGESKSSVNTPTNCSNSRSESPGKKTSKRKRKNRRRREKKLAMAAASCSGESGTISPNSNTDGGNSTGTENEMSPGESTGTEGEIKGETEKDLFYSTNCNFKTISEIATPEEGSLEEALKEKEEKVTPRQRQREESGQTNSVETLLQTAKCRIMSSILSNSSLDSNGNVREGTVTENFLNENVVIDIPYPDPDEEKDMAFVVPPCSPSSIPNVSASEDTETLTPSSHQTSLLRNKSLTKTVHFDERPPEIVSVDTITAEVPVFELYLDDSAPAQIVSEVRKTDTPIKKGESRKPGSCLMDHTLDCSSLASIHSAGSLLRGTGSSSEDVTPESFHYPSRESVEENDNDKFLNFSEDTYTLDVESIRETISEFKSKHPRDMEYLGSEIDTLLSKCVDKYENLIKRTGVHPEEHVSLILSSDIPTNHPEPKPSEIATELAEPKSEPGEPETEPSKILEDALNADIPDDHSSQDEEDSRALNTTFTIEEKKDEEDGGEVCESSSTSPASLPEDTSFISIPYTESNTGLSLPVVLEEDEEEEQEEEDQGLLNSNLHSVPIPILPRHAVSPSSSYSQSNTRLSIGTASRSSSRTSTVIEVILNEMEEMGGEEVRNKEEGEESQNQDENLQVANSSATSETESATDEIEGGVPVFYLEIGDSKDNCAESTRPLEQGPQEAFHIPSDIGISETESNSGDHADRILNIGLTDPPSSRPSSEPQVEISELPECELEENANLKEESNPLPPVEHLEPVVQIEEKVEPKKSVEIFTLHFPSTSSSGDGGDQPRPFNLKSPVENHNIPFPPPHVDLGSSLGPSYVEEINTTTSGHSSPHSEPEKKERTYFMDTETESDCPWLPERVESLTKVISAKEKRQAEAEAAAAKSKSTAASPTSTSAQRISGDSATSPPGVTSTSQEKKSRPRSKPSGGNARRERDPDEEEKVGCNCAKMCIVM